MNVIIFVLGIFIGFLTVAIFKLIPRFVNPIVTEKTEEITQPMNESTNSEHKAIKQSMYSGIFDIERLKDSVENRQLMLATNKSHEELLSIVVSKNVSNLSDDFIVSLLQFVLENNMAFMHDRFEQERKMNEQFNLGD